jgi:hypothetical protein
MPLMRRRLGVNAAIVPLLILHAAGCESDPLASPAQAIGPARAFGIWAPSGTDTCSKDVHDRYATVGPDGYLYPTWHPPVDPSGCNFGHEHGRDPRGSDLFAETGPIPFGYANQALDVWDPLTPRHEDHVGHKIEWENDVQLGFRGGAGAILAITCDVLVKLHQGTHSKDAFTNNLHELAYHIRCTDGTAMSVTLMAAIGTPGEFVSSCDRQRHITVGPATPPNSPSGGGKRALPDRSCVERFVLTGPGRNSDFHSGLHESWEISESVRTVQGRTLAAFDPYFQVNFPSRYYDPAQPSGVGRPIDLCYEVTPNGARARGGLCEKSTGNGALQGVRYDDPRSAFNGVERFVDINSNRIDNADGPDVWYSDPFGNNARTEPFPGSIRQRIARSDNTGRVGQGPVLGRDRFYGGPGSRAPN